MKAMVLFSGGIDSTTCLGMAVEKIWSRKCYCVINIIWAETYKRDRSVR